MHPRNVALFTAIQKDDTEALVNFLNENAQGAWILNDKNQSALDFALTTNRGGCVNILLQKLSHDANIDLRTREAQQAFHYALLKVTKYYCKNLTKESYLEFYQAPEKTFTFLTETNKDWITWTRSIATVQGAAYNAFNELVYSKPIIQGYIRALATGATLRAFFRQYQQADLHAALDGLMKEIAVWSTQPLFASHAGYVSAAAGWLGFKKTHTAGTLTTLSDAIKYILENEIFLSGEMHIPAEVSLEMAKKLMLLFTKCYPFSNDAMQKVWELGAHKLLQKFNQSPADYHALVESILDKQWLYTDENMPIVDTHLINKLLPEHIAFYLSSYQINDESTAVLNKKPVVVTPGEHKELLALYPLSQIQKSFVIDKPLDEPAKKFLHLLLMNNKNLSFRYTTTELFMINPLKMFPYAANPIVMDVADQAQLAHMPALAEIASHTQPHLRFAMTRQLLCEQRTLPALHSIQQVLGPKQTATLLILDTLTNRLIQSDMLISRNEIGPGPYSKALLTQKESPISFYDAYKRFSWIIGLSTKTVESQYLLIEKALQLQQPMMFIFDRNDFDSDLFDKVQTLLKSKNNADLRCIIRFDDLDAKPTNDSTIVTDCDFVVSANGTVGGPLWQTGLCNKPTMFVNAAVTVVNRPSKSTETASTSSQQQPVDLDNEQKSARSGTSSVPL